MIVGIDVSKDKLDVVISSTKKHKVIKQTRPAIKAFLKSLNQPKLVVFEATGGYEKLLLSVLLSLKIPFHRAHPNRVHHFAKGKGYFAKTDRIDAGILAAYGLENDLKPDDQQSEQQLKIQELSARRTQLKEMIRQEKNRSHGVYLNAQIKRSIKRLIKQLESELKQVSKLLDEKIKSDSSLQDRRELLQSIKGVAHEVSTIVVTDLPELGRLTREEISNLVGVAPQTRDSGKKQGYRPTGKGRGQVRKALYMAALVGMRFNQRLKAFYERLRAKGKPAKVALVALMRKLLITMNAMVKNNQPWQAERI